MCSHFLGVLEPNSSLTTLKLEFDELYSWDRQLKSSLGLLIINGMHSIEARGALWKHAPVNIVVLQISQKFRSTCQTLCYARCSWMFSPEKLCLEWLLSYPKYLWNLNQLEKYNAYAQLHMDVDLLVRLVPEQSWHQDWLIWKPWVSIETRTVLMDWDSSICCALTVITFLKLCLGMPKDFFQPMQQKLQFVI